MLAAFIMAGGSGERFWPLSTKERPKQLLKLIDENRSLIRTTVDRILPIISADKIFIGTNAIQADAIRKELSDLPYDNIIVEPAFKDTAAAIGYGAVKIKEKLKDEKITMVVLASDHIIKNEDNFRKRIVGASEIAMETNSIITLGIKPNKPETGYGYIEVKEAYIGEPSKVIRFWEKPNLERAEEYVEAGNYLWNSGMFVIGLDMIMGSFEKYMPKHFKIFNKISTLKDKNLDSESKTEELKTLFEKFEKISIDFGIMEKAQNIQVIPVDFGWNDVGSYPALDEVLEHNENGTVNRANELIEIGSKNNIIIGTKKIIATIGLEDLVVVETKDALLVCKKERAQDIKKVLKEIAEREKIN
ncbi:MAG: sugar phosphate nucleotidyltransferase [Psychrilyobacter sp.]|uniref:mannose-1-phosphate guanylyltransferase n=1 Tax=Psychrilyobacter sp. TaxID=2586924 RepID=UPI003C736459